jgi:hypothetical protein
MSAAVGLYAVFLWFRGIGRGLGHDWRHQLFGRQLAIEQRSLMHRNGRGRDQFRWRLGRRRRFGSRRRRGAFNNVIPRGWWNQLSRECRALPHGWNGIGLPQRIGLFFRSDRRAAQDRDEQCRAGGIRQ